MGKGSGIAVICGVDRRRGSDLALLWLWHRPAATTLIRPLTWEPPYAMRVALEKTKQNKTKQDTKKKIIPNTYLVVGGRDRYLGLIHTTICKIAEQGIK